MNPLGVDRVIDTHLHVWDVPRPARPYPWTPDPHPVAALLPILDACGIDRAIQVTPSIMEYDNEYGLQVAHDHASRFGVFGRFDPSGTDVAGRLKSWMARPSAEGIRLTFFGPTAARPGTLTGLRPLWEACEQLAVPVAVLAPDAVSELADVAIEHPALRLVVDHLGLGVYEGSVDPFTGWRHLARLADCPNTIVKISTLVETSTEEYPFRDVHERLAEAVELFGVERLVWGSNYPVSVNRCSYHNSLAFLGECESLDGDALEWVTYRSWERFINSQPR